MKWRSLQESGPYRDARPLREIFAERKESIAKYVPADVQAVHAQAVVTLKTQELAASALRKFAVGTKAPSFELPDQNGKPVSSAEILAQGPLVLTFIRGRWCPFCVGQMEAMNYNRSRDRGCRSDTGRGFSSERETGVFYARPAQAGLSIVG
jgi:hypothetical protein